MHSTIKLNSASMEAYRDTGQQGRSNERQQNLAAVEEKIQSPWTEDRLLFQGKKRVQHPFSQPHIDPKCESRYKASGEKMGHSKFSQINRKTLPGGDGNELVRHMSNLPGFLLKVDKDSTIQDKALNFGVLDWKRLEKWKYTERMPEKLPKRTSPSGKSFSSASGPPKLVQSLGKQPSSAVNHNPSLTYSTKQPKPRGLHFSSPERQPSPPHSSLLNSSTKKRSGRIKSKGTEPCSQEHQAAESFRFQQRAELYDRNCSEISMRKETEKDFMSEREGPSSSSNQRKLKIPLLSPNNGAQGKTSEMRFDEVNRASKNRFADPQKSLHQVPKHFHESKSSESSQSTESRTSVDAHASALTANIFSDFFSQELYSGEFPSDIQHSCSLPSSTVEIGAEIFSNENCATSFLSKPKCSTMNEESGRPPIKQPEVEQPTVKGRSPSPIRRFSFNLGKMGKSLNFKEDSAVPQSNSSYTAVRTVPEKPEITPGPCMDNSEHAFNRRSSPLRRLLDPLLKHKTAPETVQPSSENTRPVNVSKDRKHDASTLQALLQLTFRHGLPFFKLVVENSKDMLAVAVRKLPSSGKNDPRLIYSFYSVHEIKKKSMNWINQGSKSKTYSLGYNIIGRMKISNSNNKDAKECVLFGADPAQEEKQLNLDCLPNKEIAAIVVKNQMFERRDLVQNSGIIVVLPGGVHGMPINGTPSSLLSRWSSGGSCDCGGWDVGCNVRVLADSGKNSNIFQESLSNSIDHVDLYYVQGGEQKSKPVFSLKPFSSEFYSLELDASVSLLEALAISVAYVTCWKFPEIIDESEIGTRSKEQIPARYITCPPLSPAGRI